MNGQILSCGGPLICQINILSYLLIFGFFFKLAFSVLIRVFPIYTQHFVKEKGGMRKKRVQDWWGGVRRKIRVQKGELKRKKIRAWDWVGVGGEE